MWPDHNACGETQQHMRLEWQAIAKLWRALNTQQRTVDSMGSQWGSWSREVTLIEFLYWILTWCCVQDRMKGDNLEMAAKSRGEVVKAWTLTKETNDAPQTYHHRILICVGSSLNIPLVYEAGTLSGIYLTSNPFSFHTQGQAPIGIENNHRLDFGDMEGNVPKKGKGGDRLFFSFPEKTNL